MRPISWTPLRRELRAWSESGLRLPLWWRDDDATEPSAELDRLHALACAVDMPVHLAIVPAHAKPALGPVLDGGPFRGVVHGWSHRNRAPTGAKSSEFSEPSSQAIRDAARGLQTLRSLFGTQVHAMFVPPWNRIHPALLPRLPEAGFHTVSRFGPRESAMAAPGLKAINTHVDPVDWRGTRGLSDPEMVLDRLIAHLNARRGGVDDAREPLGILTHHLMMDDASWDFCRGLLSELRVGRVDLFDIANRRDIP